MDVTQRRLEADRVAHKIETVESLEEALPAVLWTEVTDPVTDHSRYTHISANSLELTGYTPEELYAERHHFTRLLHPDDKEWVMRAVAEADTTGVWDATYRIIHRDGSVRWVHSLGRRGTAPVPEEIVWHGLAIDVTAQMESAAASDDTAASEADAGAAEAAPAVDVAPPA
jgi:PAS domain S-box-containing protein